MEVLDSRGDAVDIVGEERHEQTTIVVQQRAGLTIDRQTLVRIGLDPLTEIGDVVRGEPMLVDQRGVDLGRFGMEALPILRLTAQADEMGRYTANSMYRAWQGWSFADKDWWVAAAGDQRRSEFAFGENTVAIADPDEWDDINSPTSSGNFDSTLISPAIAVGAGQTTYLSFNSHYRQEDFQTATFLIS